MAAVLFYSNDFYSGDWETATKKKKKTTVITHLFCKVSMRVKVDGIWFL